MAFVTTHDPSDRAAWSGIPASMARGFAGNGADLRYVGPLREPRKALYMAKQGGYLTLLRQRHVREREPAVLDGWAQQVERALPDTQADVVFSPSSLPIAHVRHSPLAFWTDATFGAMLDWYPHFSRLSRGTVRAGHDQERRALESVSLAIYSSRWAAESALALYGADPAKVRVIPFGANLDRPKSGPEVANLVLARPDEPCRLLWIGADWTRKRGGFALEVARELNERGLRTEITFVGERPSRRVHLPGYAQHCGWLDKSTDPGRSAFDALLSEAHFFLLPSIAETYGIAYCEASAYGVPSLASDVGGVRDAVEDGVNGMLLPLEASPADHARMVLDMMHPRETYRELAMSSRRRFEERLNWPTATKRALELIASLC